MKEGIVLMAFIHSYIVLREVMKNGIQIHVQWVNGLYRQLACHYRFLYLWEKTFWVFYGQNGPAIF
jgi:hypothetical protein